MLVALKSNVFQMGALWAWKESRGLIARSLQEASDCCAVGLMTKWSPVLRPWKLVGSQTVKQVG
jgi:hypothetical protein